MAVQETRDGVAAVAMSESDNAAVPRAGASDGHLAPELLTGNPHLDAEHDLLMTNIGNLRKICIDQSRFVHCGACLSERRSACETNLVSMLGDLLAFILEHFRTEEEIMRASLLQVIDRDLCEAHMEDHAAISGKIQEIVAALDLQQTVSLIRELDDLLSSWVGNHIMLHDKLLVRWIEREDSVFHRHNPATS